MRHGMRRADHLAALQIIQQAQRAKQLAHLRASNAALQHDEAIKRALYGHASLDALRTGEGQREHWNHLAHIANLALLLCEQDLGGEWIDKVREAQDAVIVLQARHGRIGRYVLSGPELQRLQTLLDLHDAQLASADCTEGLVVRCYEEMQRRMRAGAVLEVANESRRAA